VQKCCAKFDEIYDLFLLAVAHGNNVNMYSMSQQKVEYMSNNARIGTGFARRLPSHRRDTSRLGSSETGRPARA
jgi:hypothetical protein